MRLTPLKIVFSYLFLSVLWVTCSDLLVATIATSTQMHATLSIIKGWFFVVMTALLLYVLISRYARERDRTQEARRASQQAYQTLSENLPAIVYRVFSQENNRLQFFNQTAKTIIGYDDRDLSCSDICPMTALIVPEDRQRVIAALEHAIKELQPFTIEYQIRQRTGELRHLLEQGRPIWDDRGNLLYIDGVIFDITERKNAEQALQESEKRYHALFEGLPDAIFIADPETGIIVDTNSAASKLVGRRREEIIGIHQSKLHPPQKDEYSRETFQRHYREGGATQPVENSLLRSDGSEVPVEVLAQVVTVKGKKLIQGVFRNISKRKMAEIALKESEKKFRELADTLPQTIFEIDETGKFVYLSKTGLNTFGYTQEDVDAGLTIMQLIAAEDRERVSEDIFMKQHAGKVDIHEYAALTKKGNTFPLVLQSIPVVRRDRPIGFRGIIIDISERKYFEEELLKTQKLESLGILAGGIAHDFNNILMGIMGNLSLMRMHLKHDFAAMERLNEAEKASLHARDLTLQLLTFSKGGSPVKKIIPLERVIHDAASIALRGTNARSDISFIDGLWAVEADAGQLGQVFNNLIINACQAMPTGGTIAITMENVLTGAKDGLPVEDGRYVKIAIRDQGVGIPEEHFQKIFDPYFTTKQQGSGLGLAVTYSIIKNHKGHIALQSTLGLGSIFKLYLPAAEQQLPATQTDSEQIITGSGRVLLMDDEEIVRHVGGAILRELGYEVELAHDGSEAVEMFTKAMKASSPYAAIIMDLTVRAGMGGKEAVKMLLAVDPHARVIASSGYSQDPVMANFGEYGFRGVIAKPYKISELSNILHSVIHP